MKPTRILVTGGKNFTDEMKRAWLTEFVARVLQGYSFSESASFCEESAHQLFGNDCYEDEPEDSSMFHKVSQ